MKLFSQILLFLVLQKTLSQIFKILLRFLLRWEASHRLRSLLDIHTAVSLYLNLFV